MRRDQHLGELQDNFLHRWIFALCFFFPLPPSSSIPLFCLYLNRTLHFEITTWLRDLKQMLNPKEFFKSSLELVAKFRHQIVLMVKKKRKHSQQAAQLELHESKGHTDWKHAGRLFRHEFLSRSPRRSSWRGHNGRWCQDLL